MFSFLRRFRHIEFLSILVLSLILYSANANAATNVSGTITSDTTWPATGSPYILTGTVTVDQGVTLTLQPVTNNPIPSAAVSLSNGSSTTTDAAGYFEIVNQPSNSYTLTVSANTYFTSNQGINLCGPISQVVVLTKPEIGYGTKTDSGYSKDPVNTATGNYTYSRSDLEIPCVGLNFIFDRNYNSQDAQDGPLGFGWNHSYNSNLAVNADTSVTIRWGDGRTETWTPDGSGGFTPQYGIFDSLIDNGDGTYTLKKKDMTRYNFDSAGRLAAIIDKNGNTVSLTYTGSNLTSVTDTAGRVILLPMIRTTMLPVS